MTYEQLVKETVHLEQQLRANQRARDRHWIAGEPGSPGSLLISVHLHVDFDGEMKINLVPARWLVDSSATCNVGDLKLTGGFYNFDYGRADSLTAQNYEWLAQARRVIDRWIKGELSSLPERLEF